MQSIAAFGEVMLELAPAESTPANTKTLSYAGDTYNTALTMARLGLPTSYITRLGKDVYSQHILSALREENVDTQGISFSEDKIPGLYMISNSANGEREFSYWRGQSAARELFVDASNVMQLSRHLQNYGWLYFSGISLAILDDIARANYISFLKHFRNAGGKIAFDSNFRPRLWENTEKAQRVILSALELSSIALLTLDDEQLLWGDPEQRVLEASLSRYSQFNIDEIVFKRGAEDVIVYQNGHQQNFPVPKVDNVLDTTAAGDTFNAGYLAARLCGKTIANAVQQACACAAVIIQHCGGVIPRSVFNEELKSELNKRRPT